jgi:hypothetical protein
MRLANGPGGDGAVGVQDDIGAAAAFQAIAARRVELMIGFDLAGLNPAPIIVTGPQRQPSTTANSRQSIRFVSRDAWSAWRSSEPEKLKCFWAPVNVKA